MDNEIEPMPDLHEIMMSDEWTSDESGESLQRRPRKRRKVMRNRGLESPQGEKNSSMRKLCKNKMISSFSHFRSEGILTDVVIVVPGSPEINAHKIVLAAASPFFETMFKVGEVLKRLRELKC